jgi:hypothetical protein
MRLCWDNRRAPKRRTMAADSENTLRESMGVYSSEHDRRTSENTQKAKFAEFLFHALGCIRASERAGALRLDPY